MVEGCEAVPRQLVERPAGQKEKQDGYHRDKTLVLWGTRSPAAPGALGQVGYSSGGDKH